MREFSDLDVKTPGESLVFFLWGLVKYAKVLSGKGFIVS